MRRSRCYPGGYYEIVRPIDESTELFGYQIDKTRTLFENVKREEAEDARELADLLEFKMQLSDTESGSRTTPNLYTDGKETTSFTLPNGELFKEKRIKQALFHCVVGNVRAISQYLDVSTEAELCLHGTDNVGNTTLIMAAAEKSPEIVTLLLRHGADVEVINNKDRTALMVAALWGRIDSVKILLRANAPADLRGREGRSAEDFTRPTRKNEKERYIRSPAAADSVPERHADRRHIAFILGDSESNEQQDYSEPLTESESANNHFSKCEAKRAITLHGPVHELPVRNVSKTAAEPDRGKQFARISATSG
jgi:hypothetical protein